MLRSTGLRSIEGGSGLPGPTHPSSFLPQGNRVAFPRPFAPALIALAGTLSVAAPAQAGPSPYGKALGDTLGATLSKQLDPKSSVFTNLGSTLRGVTALLGPGDAACNAQPTSKPFAQWNDNANYVPVPNSGFEDGFANWTTVGRASISQDNHGFGISGRSDDRQSVVLGEGGSVASASFCGGIQYPTLRMMTRAASGKSARAIVTVRYTGKDGLLAALPIGSVSAGPNWGPSEITLTASGLPLFTGTKLGVTITGAEGAIAVDDVYVDPYRRN